MLIFVWYIWFTENMFSYCRTRTKESNLLKSSLKAFQYIKELCFFLILQSNI